jgi:hypothetical protein
VIIFYFVLIGGLLIKHVLTPSGAGALAFLGFAAWLMQEVLGAL